MVPRLDALQQLPTRAQVHDHVHGVLVLVDSMQAGHVQCPSQRQQDINLQHTTVPWESLAGEGRDDLLGIGSAGLCLSIYL